MRIFILTMLLIANIVAADYYIEFDSREYDKALVRQKIEDASRVFDNQLKRVIVREGISAVNGKQIRTIYYEVTFKNDVYIPKYVEELDKMSGMKSVMKRLNLEVKEGG